MAGELLTEWKRIAEEATEHTRRILDEELARVESRKIRKMRGTHNVGGVPMPMISHGSYPELPGSVFDPNCGRSFMVALGKPGQYRCPKCGQPLQKQTILEWESKKPQG